MKLTRLYALAGAALVCGSMHAATVTKLSDSSLAPLPGSVLTRKITLTDLPLFPDRAALTWKQPSARGDDACLHRAVPTPALAEKVERWRV
jgi:hypothetical protein